MLLLEAEKKERQEKKKREELAKLAMWEVENQERKQKIESFFETMKQKIEVERDSEFALEQARREESE